MPWAEMVITRLVSTLGLAYALLGPAAAAAEVVPVRHTEGLVHGFLVLRTLEGKTIAEGDLTEVANGETVTTHLLFHFRDGSLHEEKAVFSQRQSFRLLTDHLVQKGPAFQNPLEASIDTSKHEVTVHYRDHDGKDKVTTERFDLPSDTANGMVLTVLKNIRPDVPESKVSMVAFTPKPRVVTLSITPGGEEGFVIAQSPRQAMRYDVNVGIGGVTGWIAKLMGKLPPTIHVWIVGGEAPAFVKSEGPLYMGGPVWRIELASPQWSKPEAGKQSEGP